jgi:hypothetical protein
MSELQVANLFSVKGMYFLISGAGSGSPTPSLLSHKHQLTPLGIGEMMAHALDINGAAKVFILGRREASLKKVASEAVRPFAPRLDLSHMPRKTDHSSPSSAT